MGSDFTVGLVDVGEVTFLGETDATGLDIDEIVRFDDRWCVINTLLLICLIFKIF